MSARVAGRQSIMAERDQIGLGNTGTGPGDRQKSMVDRLRLGGARRVPRAVQR